VYPDMKLPGGTYGARVCLTALARLVAPLTRCRVLTRFAVSCLDPPFGTGRG